MKQLIYVSAATVPIDFLGLEQIKAVSVERNTQVGVTGLLLYGGGNFVQVLEGDDLAVDETMARIRIDPRHHQIYVVSDVAVAQREFSRWQMGFKCVDDSGHSLDFSYQNLISSTVSSSNSGRVRYFV